MSTGTDIAAPDAAATGARAPEPEPAAPARPRDPRLDSLRGLAMVAVVVGHVILGAFHGIGNAPYGFQFAFTVLTSFHVQLFAFISGYLTKPPGSLGDGAGAIGRRALQLLLPFAAWTTVFWLAGGRPLGLAGLGSMLTALAGGTPPMWFLMALFVVSLFFYLFSWNETLLVVLTCLIALWPAAVPGFCVIQAERLVPFFVAGHLAKKHGWKTGWWTAPLYLAGMWAIWSGAGANLLFPTPLWTDAFNAWASDVWWLGGSVLVRTLRVAVPLCGIGALFLAGRRWTPLQGWGTRSLGVYAAHQLVLRLFAIPQLHLPAWLTTGGVAFVIQLAVALAGAWLVTDLLSRWAPTALVFLGQGPKKRSTAAPPGPAPDPARG